jgi:hypothetical protein
MHRISLITTLIALLVGAPVASATLIVEYDIAGADGLTAPATRLADGVSADPLVLVGGTGSSGQQTGVVAATNWSAGASGKPLRHIEFVVTAAMGYAVDYRTISFALFRENGKQDRKGADLWDLYASTDNFATPGLRLLTADLSGAADYRQIVFDNQDVTALGRQAGAVSFRFVAHSPAGAQGFAGLGNTTAAPYGGVGSNVILTGDVVPLVPPGVPEPMPVLLLLVGGIPLAMRWRARVA